jgi:hypothetical protein
MDRSAARRVLAAAPQTQAILEAREIELTADPAWISPAAWNLSRRRATEALATLP